MKIAKIRKLHKAVKIELVAIKSESYKIVIFYYFTQHYNGCFFWDNYELTGNEDWKC